VLPRLVQPPLLVLAHQNERRWRYRPPEEKLRDAEAAEGKDPTEPE